MKFIVSSQDILKQLQTLSGVINNKNTLPILDNFLFELQENNLRITASDLETTFTTNIKVEADTESSIAVPARLLLDILKTFPEQPLTFIADEESQKIEINSDQGKYELAFFQADEFPQSTEIKDAQKIHFPAYVLSNAINKTIFATGNDDLRPTMNGVFFEFSADELKFVATDAHKLVKYTRTDLSTEEDAEFIMPKKPLNILKNILAEEEEDIEIEYNENNAKFVFGESEMSCRLIDGNYPNYNAVIPKENPNVLTLDRNQFLNSVRRVSIFSNQTTHQIKLNIAGSELQISAEDIDFSNRADERLTCDYSGDDMAIGFNSRFLHEMLSNLETEHVQLEMSVPSRAGILTPKDGIEEGESVLMLVMPVMLNE